MTENNTIYGKTFLVTGGAGFIGSHITEYLVNNNAKKVIVIDNLSTGFLNNIEHLSGKHNFEFYLGDITNIADCERVVTNDVDVICHQAALGSIPRSIENPLGTHNPNVNGFLNLLETARKQGVKRFIYASSSSVYGDDLHLPKNENFIGKPLSPYALTKYIDELYAYIYSKLYNMECIGLRYFNVFGPRQNPNGPYAAVIPKFIEIMLNGDNPTINGDGSFSRDFTFVENVVNANINAMTTNNINCFGENFNIGTGTTTSILELHKLINTYLETTSEPLFGNVRVGDVPHSLADINKAKTLLCYAPAIDFRSGLYQTIIYSKANHL